jgi:hydroxymethylbilane synthase
VNRIRIGTRGSKLALAQTEVVKAELLKAFPDLEVSVEIIKTQGDILLNVPMAGRLDKGFFTTEIEKELLEKRIDIAVHSLKDVPVVLPEGLTLAAVLPRADVRDVLITLDGRTIDQLNEKDVVATSSLRRRAQLLKLNPSVGITDIRGNVDTRLRKLQEGHCTALLMAAAGIDRLSIKPEGCQRIPVEQMIPAASQAIIGIEARAEDDTILKILSALNDKAAALAALSERTYLRIIEGGCHVPSGCYCNPEGDKFRLTAFISHTDGSKMIRESVLAEADELEEKAVCIANDILNAGGREIMAKYTPAG